MGLRAATRSLFADAMVSALDRKTRRQPISRMEWLVAMMLLKPQLPRQWALALRRIEFTAEKRDQRNIELAVQNAYWNEVRQRLASDQADYALTLKTADLEAMEKAITDLRGEHVDEAFYRLDNAAREAAHEAAKARVIDELRRDIEATGGASFRTQMATLERQFGELSETERALMEGRLPPGALRPGPVSEPVTAFGLSPDEVLELREQGVTAANMERLLAARERGVAAPSTALEPGLGERAAAFLEALRAQEDWREEILTAVQRSRFDPEVEGVEDLRLMREIVSRRADMTDVQKADVAALYDDFRAWRSVRTAQNEVADALAEANLDVSARHALAQTRMVRLRGGIESRSRAAESTGEVQTAQEMIDRLTEQRRDHYEREGLDPADVAGLGEEGTSLTTEIDLFGATDTEDAASALEDYREALVRRDALLEQHRLAQDMEKATTGLRETLTPYISAVEDATTDDDRASAVTNLLAVWKGGERRDVDLPSEAAADADAVERLKAMREGRAAAVTANSSRYAESRLPEDITAVDLETLRSPRDFRQALRKLRADVGADPAAFRNSMREMGISPAQPNVEEQLILGLPPRQPRRGATQGMRWWPPRPTDELLNDPEYRNWLPLWRAEKEEWITRTRDPSRRVEQAVALMGEDPRLQANRRNIREYKEAIGTRVPEPIDVLREYARTVRLSGEASEVPVGPGSIDYVVRRYEKIGVTGLRENPEVREMLRLENEPWDVGGTQAEALRQAREEVGAALRPEATVEYNLKALAYDRPLDTVDLPSPAPLGLREDIRLPRHQQPEKAAASVRQLNEYRRDLDTETTAIRRDYADIEAEWTVKEGGDFFSDEQRTDLRGRLTDLDERQRRLQAALLSHDRVLVASRSDDWNLEVPDLRPAAMGPLDPNPGVIARQIEGLEFQRSVMSEEVTRRISTESLAIERRVGRLMETVEPGEIRRALGLEEGAGCGRHHRGACPAKDGGAACPGRRRACPSACAGARGHAQDAAGDPEPGPGACA